MGADMPKVVIVNCHECTRCRMLEMACSIRNEGGVSMQLLSRDTESGAVVIQEELCNGCGCARARINL